MQAIVALGEPLYEFSRIPGIRHYAQGFGGDTANFAVAAARAGARVAYLSRIGDEPFGEELLGMWRAECVDVSGIEIEPGEPPGLYFITHGPQGHMFSYRRAGSAASAMVFNPRIAQAIERSAFLHVSGISPAISETPPASIGPFDDPPSSARSLAPQLGAVSASVAAGSSSI